MTNPELNQLYRQVIVDYAKNPHHFRQNLGEGALSARRFNASCGDVLQIQLVIDQEKISDASFDGQGCAISLAATSMLLDQLIGESLTKARTLLADFSNLILGTENEGQSDSLGDLELLAGVRSFPARIKCATLAGHVVTDVLDEFDELDKKGETDGN